MSRRYDDEELERILRLATEHGGGRRLLPGEGGGRSLEEIVAIASEAGIDTDAVRRAAVVAASVSTSPPASVARRVFGAPALERLRLRLPGPVDAGQVARIEGALEATLGSSGKVRREKAALVWSEEHGTGATEVTFMPDGEGTEVAIEARRQGHLLVLVLALVTGVTLVLQPFGGAFTLAGEIGLIPALLAWLGTPLVAARLLWKPRGERLRKRLEEAAMALAALALEPTPDRGVGALPEGSGRQAAPSPGETRDEEGEGGGPRAGSGGAPEDPEGR